jgi:phospholipid N-methyltransferase
METNKKQIGGNHYLRMKISPWDIVEGWPIEQQIGFFKGNICKYLLRAGSKDEALQDIQKAKHYLEKLESVLEKAAIHKQVDIVMKRNEMENLWVESKEYAQSVFKGGK